MLVLSEAVYFAIVTISLLSHIFLRMNKKFAVHASVVIVNCCLAPGSCKSDESSPAEGRCGDRTSFSDGDVESTAQ